MKKVLKSKPPLHKPDKDKNNPLPGYQFYPDNEDIYNKFREEKNIDPEDIPNVKTTDKSRSTRAKIGEESDDDVSGSNLDIPGSELDDEQENIGNEDEENNYYSIGGDDHNNLDEDKDDL